MKLLPLNLAKLAERVLLSCLDLPLTLLISINLATQATADLDNQNEEFSSLREHLDETIEGKKLIERQLKFGNQEIASRDAEIDKLNENIQKRDREVENLTRKNEDYKKYAFFQVCSSSQHFSYIIET